MQLKQVDRDALLKPLQSVAGIVERRHTLPILANVLLEQKEHRVTVHRRAENWKPHMYMGPQAVAEFRSIGLSVPLAQIYEGTLPAV